MQVCEEVYRKRRRELDVERDKSLDEWIDEFTREEMKYVERLLDRLVSVSLDKSCQEVERAAVRGHIRGILEPKVRSRVASDVMSRIRSWERLRLYELIENGMDETMEESITDCANKVMKRRHISSDPNGIFLALAYDKVCEDIYLALNDQLPCWGDAGDA